MLSGVIVNDWVWMLEVLMSRSKKQNFNPKAVSGGL